MTISTIITTIGIPAIILALIYIGKKLQLLDSLNESTQKIKHNISVISNHLIRHDGRFDPKELQALSPLTLTDVGKKFIEETGFGNVFEKNKDDFFAFIDGENPKLKYDVELASIKSIYALYEKDYMDPTFLFESEHLRKIAMMNS